MKRIWFGLLLMMQLAFIAVMPAGLGNDEISHLIRMWAITEGHFYCDKVPQAVRSLETKTRYAFQTRGQPFSAYWRDGLAMHGGAERVDGHTYSCHYFPLGVTLPALVTRLVALDRHGNPRRGGVFLATYAARIAGAALIDLALWWFLQLVPWAAFLALGMFSVPMFIEATVTVGHDGLLLALSLFLIATTLTRDDWIGVILIVLSATVMTLEKPVFAGFGLMAWPMLSRRLSGRRLHGALALSAALPGIACGLWFAIAGVAQRTWHPSFADVNRQAAFLARHPLQIFRVMIGYLHYFLDDHQLPDFLPHRFNGRWTTLLFANCWFEMSMIGYLLAILGLGLAALACVDRPFDWRGPRWARTAATLGAAVTIPATILALYLHYTPVGAGGPYGVQGRYHAVPWLTLSVLALGATKRRISWRGAPLLAAAACALLLGAGGFALHATWTYYWK